VKKVEIYFDDLTSLKQNEVLAAYNIVRAVDGNFDLAPLFVLEVEEEEEVDGVS